jgi:hypothetical protein
MSANDLYTVTLVRSVPIKTTAGDRIQDIIETYYDLSWKAIGALQAKHAGIDVTVEKQKSELGRKPKIEIGEHNAPANLTPIKWWEADGADLRKREQSAYVSRVTSADEKVLPERETVVVSTPEAGYAGVINELLKGSAA